MSLLTLCQNITQQTGFTSPITVVGNAAEEIVRLLAQSNRAGKELRREANWVVLQKEQTITTAATSDYAMPDDFLHFLTGTQWDRTNYWQLIGPTSPIRWQQLKSGITMSGPRRCFRLKPLAGVVRLFIDPTPSTTDTLVFEYLSTDWCQSAAGVGQDAWAADTDTGILDEDLLELGTKWRFLKSMGLPYLEEQDEYDHQLSIAKANDGGMPVLSAVSPYLDVVGPNIPDTNFTL